MTAKKLREAIKDIPDNIEIKFWISAPDNNKGIEIPIDGMFYDSDSNVLFLE